MKKIISIILGILLMFSMSVTSFAAVVPVPETTTSTTTEGPSGIITITTDFTTSPISKNTNSEFISELPLKVTITNDTASNILLSDINIDVVVNVPVKDKEGEYESIPTTGKWSEADTFVINKGKTIDNLVYTLTFKYNSDELKEDANVENTNLYAIMINDDVKVATIHGIVKDKDNKIVADGRELTWKFQLSADVEEDTSTSTDTSTPSEPEVTEKEETSTSTTQPSTSAPEVTNPVTPETEEPSKAPADVDDTIPDTGATVPFAAIGTLVTSAITALVAKKKKEN